MSNGIEIEIGLVEVGIPVEWKLMMDAIRGALTKKAAEQCTMERRERNTNDDLIINGCET
jgi:hypothetical protein